VALKQSGCPLRFWGLATKDFIKKRNALWTRTEGNGKVTTAFERMRPVGVSNNHRSIAVPFGCKIIVQIPRESSLCTDGSHGSRALEEIYVGADHSTNSIHVYLFETKKTQLSSDWTAFPDDFSFRDPDVFSDKSIFPAKAAQQMHLEDDTEQKAFVVANTRSQPMWTGNSAGIWRGARQQYTHIRGQPSMHRDVRKHCAQRAAHWCTQILCAGARRRQARQAHAVWHQSDGSRCTDEKPALSPFQNSQTNARCHIATGKRLLDVGIAVLSGLR